MRRCAWYKRAGSFVAVVVVLSATSAARAAEGWYEDFERAEAEAKRLNVPLLVHFHASWCGPCKQMEREVLYHPAVLKQLQAGFIAVQVDSDQRRDLAERFGITTLPTDVFLDPNGYLISRSERAKDLDQYRSLLASIDARFADARAARIAAQSKLVVTPPKTPAPAPRPTPIVTETTAPHHVTPPPLAPNPGALRREQWGAVARTAPPEAGMRPVPYSAIRRPRALGLHGYSPVALVTNRQWLRGDPRYAMDYKGIVYQFASVDEFRRFRESPERFAPQILGCDPVILDITDRAVSGDIRYAAFFDGELFLFVSDKSRLYFEQDPERFVRTKHVLNVDELDDKRLE